MPKKYVIVISLIAFVFVYGMLLIAAHIEFKIPYSNWKLYLAPFVMLAIGTITFLFGGSRNNKQHAKMIDERFLGK